MWVAMYVFPSWTGRSVSFSGHVRGTCLPFCPTHGCFTLSFIHWAWKHTKRTCNQTWATPQNVMFLHLNQRPWTRIHTLSRMHGTCVLSPDERPQREHHKRIKKTSKTLAGWGLLLIFLPFLSARNEKEPILSFPPRTYSPHGETYVCRACVLNSIHFKQAQCSLFCSHPQIGKFLLICNRQDGLALSVKDANPAENTEIILAQPAEHTEESLHQAWYLDEITGTLRSALNDYCLDIIKGISVRNFAAVNCASGLVFRCDLHFLSFIKGIHFHHCRHKKTRQRNSVWPVFSFVFWSSSGSFFSSGCHQPQIPPEFSKRIAIEMNSNLSTCLGKMSIFVRGPSAAFRQQNSNNFAKLAPAVCCCLLTKFNIACQWSQIISPVGSNLHLQSSISNCNLQLFPFFPSVLGSVTQVCHLLPRVGSKSREGWGFNRDAQELASSAGITLFWRCR